MGKLKLLGRQMALFEMGNTKVIATVYGPREVRSEYNLANFSTGDRARKSKGDR